MTDGPAGYGAPPPPASQFTIPKEPMAWLLPGAAILAFLGSLLPWVTVSVKYLSINQSSSTSGVKATEGVFVLILSLVLLALAVLPWTSVKVALPPVTTLAVAGLLFVCAIWGLIDVLTSTSDASDTLGGLGALGGDSGFSVGAGFGLWVTVIAAILAVVGAYLDFKKKSAPAAM